MKILMVCLGNICRSPIAHGIMEQLIGEEELDWEVDSAGTSSIHKGSAPDKRSIAVAKKYGIDISAQRSRQFSQNDFAHYEHIYAMDKDNFAAILSLARDEEDKKRVSLLVKDTNVPDPYYDDSLFEPVYHMIDQACRSLIKDIRS